MKGKVELSQDEFDEVAMATSCINKVYETGIGIIENDLAPSFKNQVMDLIKQLHTPLTQLHSLINESRKNRNLEKFERVEDRLRLQSTYLSPLEAVQLIAKSRDFSKEMRDLIFSYSQWEFSPDPRNDIMELVQTLQPFLGQDDFVISPEEVLKHLVEIIWRNSVEFSHLGLERRLEILRRQIANLEAQQKQLEDETDPMAQELQDKIKKLRGLYQALTGVGPIGVRQAFVVLQDELRARGMNHLAEKVFVFLNEVVSEKTKNLMWKGLVIREGDMLLVTERSGFGSMFHSMIGLKNLIGHVVMVGRYQEDGVDFFLRMEMDYTLSYKSIWRTSEAVVVVRPNFFVGSGFTRSGIDYLDKQRVLFDSKFELGLTNSNGDFALYCSEFVDFVFRGADGLGLSPYSYTINKLFKIDPLLKENMELAGVDLTAGYLTPDNLLTNPGTTVVGFRFAASEAMPLPYLSSILQVAERYNDDLARLFSSRKLKPIGFIEQSYLRLKILVGGKLNKLPGSFDLHHLPEDETKYYLVKIAEPLVRITDILSDKKLYVEGEQMVLLDALDLRLKARYEEHVLPALEELFE